MHGPYIGCPEAELWIIGAAGHAVGESEIVDALITATQNFADHLVRSDCCNELLKRALKSVGANGEISAGLLVLVGVERGDSAVQADRLLER